MSGVEDGELLDIERDRVRAVARENLFGVGAEPVRIGRFEVLRQLGAGAMGVVYLAHDPELDRRVAIKLLRPDVGPGFDRARERIQREARALAQLSHPNIVGVYDAGTHKGQFYIAMEYVAGETFLAWRLRAKPGWPEVVQIMADVADALAAAHHEGLIHRDIKPENILMDDQGNARLADFGLVLTTDEQVPTITNTGAILGTPAFMAPEQLRGHRADERADIYSLCATLFDALFGHAPLDWQSSAKEIQRAGGTPRSAGHVPVAVVAILKKGLATHPDERHQSATTLAGELRGALCQTQERSASRFASAVVLTLAVAALGVVAWQLARGSQQTSVAQPQIDARVTEHAHLVATKTSPADASTADVGKVDAAPPSPRRLAPTRPATRRPPPANAPVPVSRFKSRSEAVRAAVWMAAKGRYAECLQIARHHRRVGARFDDTLVSMTVHCAHKLGRSKLVKRACLERDRHYAHVFRPMCDDLRKRRNSALSARMASLMKRRKFAECVVVGRREIRPLPATLVAMGRCAVEANNRAAVTEVCHRLTRVFPHYKDNSACAGWLRRVGASSR